jgi:hypothetical protein
VRLALDNPAQTVEDELADANRVAETVAAARACRNTVAYLDTLNDVDRGYYPRLGLVDRRFNPRLAGRVFQHLQAALEDAGEPVVPGPVSLDGDLRAIALVCARTTWSLLLPARPLTLDQITLVGAAGDKATRLRWIDLAAGVVEPALACAPSSDGKGLRLIVPRTIAAPALICAMPDA